MKTTNRKGFTLAELLIVVAIIGVLIAISIPIFTSQMDRAKIAVDQANVRSAKAAALADWMTTYESGDVNYYYDAGSGTVKREYTGIVGYGKYKKNDKAEEIGASGYPNKDGKAAFVHVNINTMSGEPIVTCIWETGNGYSSYYSQWQSFAASHSDIFNDNSGNSRENSPTGDNTALIFLTYKDQFGSNENRKQADGDGLQEIADALLNMTFQEFQELTGTEGTKADYIKKNNEQVLRYTVDKTGTINYTSAWNKSGAVLSLAGFEAVNDINRNNNVLSAPLFFSDEALAYGNHNVTVQLKTDASGNIVQATVKLYNEPDKSSIVKTAKK